MNFDLSLNPHLESPEVKKDYLVELLKENRWRFRLEGVYVHRLCIWEYITVKPVIDYKPEKITVKPIFKTVFTPRGCNDHQVSSKFD